MYIFSSQAAIQNKLAIIIIIIIIIIIPGLTLGFRLIRSVQS